MQNDRLPYLQEKVKKLPHEPGCYIMRDSGGKIIYIGKAKELRIRVASYFRSVDKHEQKTYRLVENIHDFDYIVTTSEFEALVLEASLIKQHKPKYNILLKDDKGYHYIKVSPPPYSRITFEMQRGEDANSRWLGPYTSSFLLRQTVEEVNTSFSLPTCKRKFPQEIGKGRPCLNYHIKRCMGVCTGKISEQYYQDTIEQALEFIAEGSERTIERMTAKMEAAAEALDFEQAATLRDRIRVIHHRMQKQNVVFTRATNQDVFAFAQTPKECCVSVLKFREQRLVDKQDHLIGEIGNLPEARREFLTSYYNSGQEIPRQISLDGDCEDQELLERFLTERLGRNVSILQPARGEKLKLVEMARQNAAQTLSHRMERTGKELAALDELAKMLHLDSPPEYIELYDISNMGSETVVAGMVVFENGRPLKSAYKKFNIKTVIGTDDYASMREVIARRFSHYEEEKDKGTGFGRLPDLILLDGGKTHVGAVAPVLEDLGFGGIPLYGLVKDQKHRTRAIATDGGEISIVSNRSAFTLLSKMQDEVHRFSIAHMQNKRKQTAFASTLSQVEGIGETRLKALLRHFRTQAALRTATEEELAAVKGMSRPVAQRLYAFLHPEE